MAKKVNIEQLAKTINEEVSKWGNTTIAEVEEIALKHAEELKERIKRDSPKRKKKGGKYKRSWAVKQEGVGTGKFKYIVHNKKYYRLTHLLEYGHATPKGTRTKAQEHIFKNSEDVKEDYQKEVEKVLSGN